MRGYILAFILLSSVLAVPASAEGPLPTTETTEDLVSKAVVQNEFWTQEALKTVGALVADPNVLLEDPEFVVDEGHRDARAIELAARGMLAASTSYSQAEWNDGRTFALLVAGSTMRAAGLGLQPSTQSHGIPVPALSSGVACTNDVQGAIDQAQPGDEIVACPGVHQPFTVDQHFLTVRSQQGPLATTVESASGPAITVTAAGVTLEGFQVHGAETAIFVGDPDATLEARTTGDLTKTTLRGNLLRDNGQGIVLWSTVGTVIAENTIRGTQGPAVLVEAQAGTGGLTDGAEREALGTLVVSNNFIANRGLAIENHATVPVIAAGNYYGTAAGPPLQVAPAGTCIGASAPLGDARCHNAVGTGVVTLGFSPVAIG